MVNTCYSILKKDTARYTAWSKCTSRVEEVRDPKHEADHNLRLNSEGYFIQAETKAPGEEGEMLELVHLDIGCELAEAVH